MTWILVPLSICPPKECFSMSIARRPMSGRLASSSINLSMGGRPLVSARISRNSDTVLAVLCLRAW